ncbi:MAG TPA: PAS domain S-box protein [Bacillota bacterium]|nr:PAS domain S-box protein [Bacillota bacterium]
MNQSFWEKCLPGAKTMGEPAQAAQLKMILDVMAEAITVYDPQGRILLTNQAMQDILKLWGGEKTPENQWRYDNQGVLFLNDSQEIEPEAEPSARVLRGERFSGYEVQVWLKETGQVFYYCCNGSPIYDETGNLQVGIVTMIDITGRRQAKADLRASEAKSLELMERAKTLEELRASEQKYKDLIKYAGAGIFEVDFPGNRFRSINDIMCEMMGYTREELFEMSPYDLLDDQGKILSQARFNQLLNGEEPGKSMEYRVKSKNGREIYVALNMNFRYDEHGKPNGAIVIVHDITERRRNEEKIQRQNAILEGINRILQSALTSATEMELGLACLKVVEELTGSKVGFIGVLDLEGNSIIRDSWDLCWMGDTTGHGLALKKFKIPQISEQVFLEGKPHLINRPTGDPSALGLPEGHPPVSVFLGVPLFHDQKTIGMIGIGNREGGYSTEDIETVEILGQAIVQALIYKRAALALRQSEYRLDLALEGAGAGMWFWDPVFGLQTTPGVNALFGHSSKEPLLQEKEYVSLIYPEDLLNLKKAWRGATQQGGAFEQNIRVVWPDGSIHWLASKGRVSSVTAGLPQLVGITYDITEDKRIREELEQRERDLITFIDNIPGFVYFKDLEDRMVFPNQRLCDLCGLTREELIGRSVYEEGQPKEVADMFYADDMRVMATGAPLYVEEDVFDHGKPTIVATYKTALKDPAGKVIGLAGISMDITERKRIEMALRESEERFRGLFENMTEAFCAVRILGADLEQPDDLQFIELNSATASYVGLPHDQIIGRRFREIFPQSKLTSVKWIADVLRTGQPLVQQNWFRFQEWERFLEIRCFRAGQDIAGVIATDHTEAEQVRERLRENEEKYRNLFDSMTELVATYQVVRDEQGLIIERVLMDANPAFLKIAKAESLDALKGKTAGQIFGPEYMDPNLPIVREVMATGSMRYFEWHFGLNKEDYLTTITPLNQDMFLTTGKNITERKQIEEALHNTALIAEKHAAELDAVISSIAEGVVVYDLTGNITRINDFARNIFGYSIDEYPITNQERSVELKMCKADGIPYEADETPLFRALHGTIIRDEEVLQYRNGCPIWLSATLAPIHDSNNNAKGVVFTFTDITERKRKVAEVLASERELLQVTLNSLGEGVVATDQEERIILFNEAAVNLTGYSSPEAIGAPLDKIFYIFDDQTSEPIPITASPKESHHPILVSRNLTEIPIALSHSPIRTPDGLIIGTVMVFQDISAQQKIQQELLKTEKLESLGILAGGIAHDFNNILAAILANVQLALVKLHKNQDIESYLVNTVETTRKASDLTKQLLTFSKGGAPVRKDAALNNLITDTAEFALRGAQVKAEFMIPDDLWVASIDEGQISQVIQNLVINAKQAMPKGGILRISAANVTVHEASRFLPGNYVKISVCDQGMGISRENLSKIFDPFFTTKQNGNGLGLTTSYSIIHRHNGYIDVESQEDQGTTFFIYLPASVNGLAQETVQSPPAPPVERIKILMMDDEENILNAVGEMLRVSFGYQVSLAKDGAVAIELYQRSLDDGAPFDIVIIDLTVPGGMGGQETIAYLRDINPKIKAIVSSGYATDPVMADYERFGFMGVISKPYKIDELNEVVHKVLDQC